MKNIGVIVSVSAILLFGVYAFPSLAANSVTLEKELVRVAGENGELSKKAHKIRKELLEIYDADYRYYDSARHLKMIVEYVETKHGTTSVKSANKMYELGRALRHLGYYFEALEYLEQAYEIHTSKLGSQHRKTFRTKYELARIYGRVGQYDNSLQLIEEMMAEAAVDRQGNETILARLEVELGNVYRLLGDFDKAEKLLLNASSTLRKTKGINHAHYGHAQLKLGHLYQSVNRLVEAEQVLQGAYAQMLPVLGPGHSQVTGCMVQLSKALIQQGRYSEAKELLLKAVDLRAEHLGPGSHKTTTAMRKLIEVYINTGEYKEAESIAVNAISLLSRERTDPDFLSLLKIRLMLAEIYFVQDRTEEANSELAGLLKYSSNKLNLFQAQVHWLLGKISLQKHEFRAALVHFEKALSSYLHVKGSNHPDTGRILSEIAQCYEKMGDYQGTVDNYRSSIASMSEFLSNNQTQSEFALNQQEEVAYTAVQKYLTFLMSSHASESILPVSAVKEGFVFSEMGRDRAQQRMFLSFAARIAAANSKLNTLARREQDLRRELGEIEEQIIILIGQPETDMKKGYVANLIERRRELDKQIEDLNEKVSTQFPKYDRLMNPGTTTVVDVQGVLDEDEVLLAYYVTDKTTILWAISGDSVVMQDLGMTEQQLTSWVERLRASLDINIKYMHQIPAYDAKLANLLYKKLVMPVESMLKGASDIAIVPHGPLYGLPFEALVTGEVQGMPSDTDNVPFSGYKQLPWLVNQYAVSIVPSATALVTLRKYTQDTLAGYELVGFADPDYSGVRRKIVNMQRSADEGVFQRAISKAGLLEDLPRLPDTAYELEQISAAVPDGSGKKIYLGPDASETNVKTTQLQDYRSVIFSTHGLLAGDLDKLDQPALALSRPERPNDYDDGLLKMEEILLLRLNASWVILSACNTATPDGEFRGDELGGLAQAFFYAGARAVLASLWSVESTSTARLFTIAFADAMHDTGLSRSRALTVAKRKLISGRGYVKNGAEVFSYAHPLFWAAFVLIGDGSRY